MTRRVALLIAANLASDAPDRRADASLFDHERRVLEAAFSPFGLALETMRWTDDGVDWSCFDAALVLACWDYQDDDAAFLARLARIELAGCRVFNPPELVRWNIRKTYLRELGARGVRIVPTLWCETPVTKDIREAFDLFGCDEVVLKRQVGAGARGQARYSRKSVPADGPVLDRPGMIQPLVSSVVGDGEYSFLFIDGVFSHALIKRPAAGDYRIQAAYGGRSEKIDPTEADLTEACAVLRALAEPPLYARVDMARGEDGRLMLMELEAIEPFLFPNEGPQVGDMLAAAIAKRLRQA